ncbi:MAG: hypothetical protein M3R02_27660 [Chloroflexota bacterium]|nr:hypothetical protein [Chloroflexota bacterium]MDP9459465.1 hypothetical protein [Actinomycetota bacterium]
MRVRGIVHVDLSRADLTGPDAASTARGLIWSALLEAPQGADVHLVVPRWGWWAPFAAEEVRAYADHLGEVTVESDAATVRRWVLALRYGAAAVESSASGW